MGIIEKLGFGKLKASLAKTRENLTNQVSRLMKGRTSIDSDTLAHLEEILIGADVGVDTSASIIEALKVRARQDRYVGESEFNKLLKETIATCLPVPASPPTPKLLSRDTATPFVVMVVGVNGVGKTTTIGKLAARYRSEGKSVLIAASDTFRAAANEQLEVWASRAGAGLLKQEPGADPAAVAFDALHSARASGTDILIIDTAGRLHTRVNLMEELKKIRRVLQKAEPSAPHEVLLVLDASTGQNGLQQARQFTAAVGVTGIILTKLDGTARGGIVFAIASELGIPVLFVGVGEGIDDLEPFNQAEFIEALFSGDNARGAL